MVLVRLQQTSCRFTVQLLSDASDLPLKGRDKEDQNALKQLGALPDPERERRYDRISDALDINPDLRLTKLDPGLPQWQGIEDAIEPEPDGPPTY